MEKYATIFHRAAARHGGEEALREKISQGYRGLYFGNERGKSNDRWLAEFSLRIFQAGFNWSVVEKKWAGFEAAFWNFNPVRCAQIDMDDMERLTTDKAIVRNPVKIKTVPKNAQMILNMAETSGSADAFIRGWPREDYIGLMDYLQKNGSYLGFNTASYVMRFSGIESFVLSSDVTAALIHAGVIAKPATSKTAKRAVQAAFNAWAQESGQSLTVISRTLGYSIDGGS